VEGHKTIVQKKKRDRLTKLKQQRFRRLWKKASL